MKQLLLLAGFEWRYHTRQNGFRFAVLCFAALGAFVHGRLGGSDSVHMNAPYVITYGLSLLSLLSVFAAMVFCASAMLRDTDYRMTEIVGATPVHRRTVLLARFGGAFGATLTATCALALGMFAATFQTPEPGELLGPRMAGPYLFAVAVIILPNVALVSALLFTVAAFTRSMIATYTAAVLLYALYWTAAILGGSPMLAQTSPPTAEGMKLAAMLDPFAISAVMQQGMHWNHADKNTQLITLGGQLLANRLLVLSAAAAILLPAYRRFRFTPAAAGGKAKRKDLPVTRTGPVPAYRPVPVRPSQWQSFIARVRLELGVVLKGWPFIAMMLTWVFLLANSLIEGISNADGGGRALAHASLLLNQFQFQMLPLFGTLLVIFYSGELAWRERTLRIDGILDCTPVSSAAFFTAKLVALASLPLLMIALAIACSVAFQLATGYAPSGAALYLSLFYYAGVPLVLTAVLALFFQALTANKYLGMLLTGACTVAAGDIGAALGIEHPMLQFARAPRLVHTGMNGYGESTMAFHWYMAYWGALAALLTLASLVLWIRGQQRSMRKAAPIARLPGVRVAAVLSLGGFGAAGAHIYLQTNVNGNWENTASRIEWMAQYEQRYARYRDMAQARVEAVRSEVSLYPAEGRFRIRGEYRLRNHTEQPIGELLVATSRFATTTSLALNGARAASRDERFGQTVFQLERALQPGQETILHFEVEARRDPFSERPSSMSVGANATLLFAPGLLPAIGYLPRFELDNPAERARHGLPPKAPVRSIESEVAAGESRLRDGQDWRTFDTVISTEAGQTAFAPGRLVAHWQSGTRRYFHYRTERPVRDVAGFFSGRYQASHTVHRGVKVEIYHHPDHAGSVATMRAAALASLDYFQPNFGPYQYDHLRIIEVPASAGLTGFAMPGLILIGEQGGFMADLRAPRSRSQVTRRIAHEVAHQWWGHQLAPAQAEGSLVLVETLTKYAEMRILEQVHGSEALREQVDYELSRYLIGSANEEGRELPLYRTAPEQSYLMYSKGAIVMHGLTASLGAQRIDAALRDLLAAHAYPGVPATTLDLIAALQRRAPAQHDLIEESFMQIARYDLKANAARYRRMDDGRYRVTVQLSAGKALVDQLTGRAGAARMTVPLQIAVYDRDRSDQHVRTLYLGSHLLHPGPSEVEVIVSQPPGMVEIEPNLRLVELDRKDNVAVPVAD